MLKALSNRQAIIGIAALSTMLGHPAIAAIEVTASRSLTVQATGPRPAPGGTNYFNVQGNKNEKFASFGVLVFRLPKSEVQENEVIKGLDIAFVQSIPRFAKNGKLKFFLVPALDQEKDFEAKVKFDPKSANGLGDGVFKVLHPLGAGTFNQMKTGHTDTFSITADEAGRKYLREQLRAGGEVIIVVVPDDDDVAATYFGAGNETPANRPRLIIGPGSAR
jgi:hypothetical protein